MEKGRRRKILPSRSNPDLISRSNPPRTNKSTWDDLRVRIWSDMKIVWTGHQDTEPKAMCICGHQYRAQQSQTNWKQFFRKTSFLSWRIPQPCLYLNDRGSSQSSLFSFIRLLCFSSACAMSFLFLGASDVKGSYFAPGHVQKGIRQISLQNQTHCDRHKMCREQSGCHYALLHKLHCYKTRIGLM